MRGPGVAEFPDAVTKRGTMSAPPVAWARNFESNKQLGVLLHYLLPDKAFTRFAAELELVGISIYLSYEV